MFFIDDISSKSLGIIAEEETFLARAPLIYEEVDALKDGGDFNVKKYGNVVRSMNLYFIKEKNIDRILKLLTGTHKLTYNDRVTTINFFDVIEINRFGSKKSATVNFIRSPFWYPKVESKIVPKYLISKIINSGNVYSKPIIELEGTGKATIQVNDVTFKYNFDSDKKVIIDCEEKTESYNGKSKSKNIEIGFEYPVLNPGVNTVKVSEGTKLTLYRKDRWL